MIFMLLTSYTGSPVFSQPGTATLCKQLVLDTNLDHNPFIYVTSPGNQR